MKHKPAKTRNGGQWTSARFNSFVMSALRSASRRWGPAYAAKKAARVGRNAYVCAACKKIFGSKEIKIDHIEPVRTVTGQDNSWDATIARMFPEVDGFQVLCKGCHNLKTSIENACRREAKKQNKQ